MAITNHERGGKTHSMLALYHLFAGVPVSELPGIETVLQEAGVSVPPRVRRVALVGNKISPGNPIVKEDGTEVRTLWGEMAWQLGGRAAYERIRQDHEGATNPGDRMRDLVNTYGPALILIDEWVAYARQLHDQGDLPAGSFEIHFTFAQALAESAKLAKNTLLVVSLPASGSGGSPHPRARGLEPAQERHRSGRAVLAAGQLRGGLRDPALAALRGHGRARAVHCPRQHGARRNGRATVTRRTDCPGGVSPGGRK